MFQIVCGYISDGKLWVDMGIFGISIRNEYLNNSPMGPMGPMELIELIELIGILISSGTQE